MNRLSQSQVTYIRTQIQRLESGRYARFDCLWRIASAADIMTDATEINDSNRAEVERWIEGFKQQYGN